MIPNLPALLAVTNEDLIVSLGSDLGFIEINIDAVRRAGAALTFGAMTMRLRKSVRPWFPLATNRSYNGQSWACSFLHDRRYLDHAAEQDLPRY
jgi:hypothetical protein